ncbi:MAG TPA: DUF3943 domain-containing protein [Nitrospira sp.]|nr:DUF3943 domain-containing protein [Nitrospira sp.]
MSRLLIAFVFILLRTTDGILPALAAEQSPHHHQQELIGPVPLEQAASDRRNNEAGWMAPLNWETGTGRSYILPATEVLAYLFLLNQFDRHFTEPTSDYRTNGDTIKQHLTDSKWVLDNDQFSINQFLHPYGGSVYYGLARSAGLSFWESFLYSSAGSFLWEIAGETTSPSINDMIATPIGGTFLGEPLFRMASLLLETADGKPGFWHELGAAVLSPPTGFNRLVFGHRFDTVFPSRHPATFLRLQVGGILSSTSHNVPSGVREYGAIGDFTFTYGLPGKKGYRYERPFDYFDLHVTGVTTNTLESLNTRGLLLGTSFTHAESTRGVWGLFGSYDYISPQIFRTSTVALSLGTVWQSWLSQSIALQGALLSGIGYGAAGNVQRREERDYHYGTTGQGLLALRLIFGDRALIDFTGREYYVSGLMSPEPRGQENMLRGEASLTIRVIGSHGLALRYAISHRDAHYPTVTFRNQTIDTISLMYVFLGQSGLGAVEWR